jgi:hypothetical protein
VISDVVDRTLTQVRGSILKLPMGRQKLVHDNRYGTPIIANFPSGWQPVSAGFPCRNVFFVMSNLLALQKVTLSFALVAFRSGQQSTSAGGSAHSHSVSGQTASSTTSGSQGPNHTHTLNSDNVAITNALGTDASGTILRWNLAGSPLIATSGENLNHTHPVPAAGVSAATSSSDSAHTHNLNAPNAIYETGLATGCTVILDGTTILAGPYNSNQNELDITAYVTGSGQHEIQITSTALGGIFGHVQVVGLVKAY